MSLEEVFGLDRAEAPDGLSCYIEALQRWRVWRNNPPLFYSTCIQSALQWPSLTVQLFPHLRPSSVPGLLRHAILYGGTAAEDGFATISLASVAIDDPITTAAAAAAGRPPLPPDAVHRLSAPLLEEVCVLRHQGDVDRLRYCPGRPALVAVKCSGERLSLYDIGPRLGLLDGGLGGEGGGRQQQVQEGDGREREGGEGMDVDGDGGGSGPTMRKGAGSSAAGAGAAAAAGEDDGQGGEEVPLEPVSVLSSEQQDGVSLAWGSSSSGGGSGGPRLYSGLRCGAVAEYAVREDGSLAEVAVRQGGHDGDADVVDLAWGSEVPWEGNVTEAGGTAAAATAAGDVMAPPGLLASVGTDGRTLLWDPRQLRVALHAPRCRQDVNGVAFSPPGSGGGGGSSAVPQLANAGNDGVIRVYDIRYLHGGRTGGDGGGGGGGGSAASTSTAAAASHGLALHRLKGHNCPVRQLSYGPHSGGLLASADEQGRVLLWELGCRTALQGQQDGRGLLTTRPELLFVHAGHVLSVDDFSWSTELYGTLASVSGFLDPEVVEKVRQHPRGGAELEGQPPAVQVWRPAADMLPPPPSCSPSWRSPLLARS
ncbi:hypothetical protein Agub_g9093 [Astrephomene gubernaculifera]|uniref:Histone-binding protein RBBP4-like N-terminal domain-containing protein n=1 Tax=Astrephomene gubernaculifera TaxID=47775 RepID=A0AAD3DSS7_9CHLO|nr:hypothetical protein Agub_g9093 [Astrephomene gubernaculifera]